MEDADLAYLARQMAVPLEDADRMYAEAVADAPHDPARALRRYVELLHERRGTPHADDQRRPGWPGKRALSSRLSAPGAQRALHARPTRSRADRGQRWPGQNALTSRLAAPSAAQYALRSAESTASPDDQVDASLDQALRYSRGIPLPADLRRVLEGMFAQRFDDVQVHLDNSASIAATSIHARAFTIANHLFFRGDTYRPDTMQGLELIAHELAHVIQWRQGRIPQVSGTNRISDPGDALEQDATATAQGVTRAPSTAPAHDPPGVSAATGTHPRLARAPVDAAAPGSTSAATAGLVLRAGPGDPHASVDVIPSGGTAINQVGIVAWDGSPPLRLRSSPSTTADNVVSLLKLNTHVQVIKELPGKWYFVSTQDGQLGYVAKDHVKTTLPEPNATLHRVEAGLPGTAIAIAEKYYRQYARDWGQDLRFYVNVLAWVNKRTVPDTTDGWRDVRFEAGDFIWIPSHDFARSLRGVVNSGSISHNIADRIGIAGFLDRTGELWDDFRTAVALSMKYLPEALGRHVEAAILGVLQSLVDMLVISAAILAISTALGAALGALAGGVGAAPGAAAGFEVGLVLINWLGIGMLVVWAGQALKKVGSAFGAFLAAVWNARGDERKLDLAARQFAEACGTLLGVLVEAVAMYAASRGTTKALGGLRGTRFGKAFNNAKAGEWLNERVRRVKSGEAAIPTPKDAFSGMIRGVELVDAKNSPLGEFDGIDMGKKQFVENKSATGIDKPNPKTGQPQQTAAQWAAKQITKKTTTRIKALANAAATRGPGGKPAPSLAEIQGFRNIEFMIDGESPALRAAVAAELAALRTTNPGWTFTAEFGIKISLPPVPGTGQPDDGH